PINRDSCLDVANLKPKKGKVDEILNYYLEHLPCIFNSLASNNILFLFTNARSTHYEPGDTGPALQDKEGNQNVDIPYNKKTVFCFDNEAFRFAVASAPPNNVIFQDTLISDYETSWCRSVNECHRLLDQIKSLHPHKVMDTLSLNNAKQNILLLTQPLADIATIIARSVKECEAHQKRIEEFKGNIDALQKELYIPSMEIETEPLEHPMTVYSDTKCCSQQNINGTIKMHYKTKCHSPCYLKYSDGNIVGNAGLLDCVAFNKYEGTSPFEWRDPNSVNIVPDQNIKYNDEDELKKENETITTSKAKFACFLINNALTPFNDSFVKYVEILIKNEKNSDTIHKLEELLKRYKYEKELILSVKQGGENVAITVDGIDEMIKNLCELKCKGQNIKTLLSTQINAKAKNHVINEQLVSIGSELGKFMLAPGPTNDPAPTHAVYATVQAIPAAGAVAPTMTVVAATPQAAHPPNAI
ncbi:unnamed protein product, partial [Oppiella nova]